MKSYDFKFVLYLVIILIVTSTYLPFFTNVSILLSYTYGFSLTQIALMMSVPIAPTLVLCPLLSYVSDRRENRGWFLFIACLMACACFIWLLLIKVGTNSYEVLVPLFLG